MNREIKETEHIQICTGGFLELKEGEWCLRQMDSISFEGGITLTRTWIRPPKGGFSEQIYCKQP